MVRCVKILSPTLCTLFQKLFTLIWPNCSYYPTVEGHLDFWVDYLKKVPLETLEEYQHLLEVSQSRANQSSRAPLSSTLAHQTTRPFSKKDYQIRSSKLDLALSKSKEVSIEMEGLSAQEQTKRRNSCLAAFQTCNDTTIPNAAIPNAAIPNAAIRDTSIEIHSAD